MNAADFREQALKAITEKAWQRDVLEAAHNLGWSTYHTWLSALSSPGFPDLVLVRDRILFAELKTMRGKITDNQTHWLAKLEAAGAEVYVWRPADFPNVIDTLQ